MSSTSSNASQLQEEDRHQLSSPSRPTPWTQGLVHRLSLEVHSRILQYAVTPHVDYVNNQTDILCGEEMPITPSDYYIGRVCRLWHAIFLRMPSLWTRITAFIDKPHSAESLASSPLQQALRRSSPLPISVYLRRKLMVGDAFDLAERSSTQALLNALKDHLERVEVLVVETSRASTLPNALNLLTATDGFETSGMPLNRLRCIVLRCQNDGSSIQPLLPRTICRQVNIPFCVRQSLTTLYLDGRNVMAILSSSIHPNGLGLEDAFGGMVKLETLGVNNLTSQTDGFSEQLVDYLFLDVVPLYPRLTTLMLENVDLGPDVLQQLPRRISSALRSAFDPPAPNAFPRLLLRAISRDSIEYVLTCIKRPHTLILAGCSLSSLSSSLSTFLPIVSCSKLIIANITVDPDHCLPALIANWNGEHLELIRCACVDKGFWNKLYSSPLAPGHCQAGPAEITEKEYKLHENRNRQSSILRRLRTLKLVDCPNLLPDSLILFLLHLKETSLEDLVITGDQSPQLRGQVQLDWAKKLASRKVEWRPLNEHF